ncbi:transcriptional regulator [archaeon D22]|nr:transcriptional regulator [archaeon D22]
MTNEQKVIDALKKAGEPLRPGQIAEISGLAKEDVSKACKVLKESGKIDSPKRCFYGLK